MQKISGHIVSRANGRGIANIVVRAYDCSLSAEEIGRGRVTAGMLKSLGRHISSVLTDDAGRFEFTEAQLTFVGNDPRPDLAIIAFAPEDIDDPDRPFADPPEDRILYMTVVPQADAGAEEVFHIRLSQAQLAKYAIDPETNRLAGALEGAWDARDALNKRLKLRVREERERAESNRQAIKEKTQHLSGLPRALRDSAILAVGKRNLEAKRDVLQRKAIEEGMAQWSRAHRPPQMRLHLSEDDLSDLGISTGEEAKNRPIDAGVLFAKLATLTESAHLSLARRVPVPSPEALQARYLGEASTSLVTRTNSAGTGSRRKPTK